MKGIVKPISHVDNCFTREKMAKEYHGTWKEIWTQKGAEEGTKENALLYGGWNKTETSAKEICEKLSSFMNIKNEEKILEIGCGAGGMAQFLECDYIGIDYSATSVKKCMEFFQKTALCEEADRIPFVDKYFDKSFAYGCFMYFDNLEYAKRVIDQMFRVTKEMIFIGELPITSSESKHLLFDPCWFEKEGFTVIDGWAAPYQKSRFSAYIKL